MGDGHMGRSIRCWLRVVIFTSIAVVDPGAVACSHVDGPSGGAACDAAACDAVYADAVRGARGHGCSDCKPSGAHCYAPSGRW